MNRHRRRAVSQENKNRKPKGCEKGQKVTARTMRIGGEQLTSTMQEKNKKRNNNLHEIGVNEDAQKKKE